MRKAKVYLHGIEAGMLEELLPGKTYRFSYKATYLGEPVSLMMPLSQRTYEYADFPPVFEGLLPEGLQLEGLLRRLKIDRNDFFRQLMVTGGDLVGAITVQEVTEDA
jgi:serine/threonine-protein kinase HipA